MTDYYVDPANGSDSNSGTSTTDAWETFGPIDPYDGRVRLDAGDTVYARDSATHDVSEIDLRGYTGTSSGRIVVRNYPNESPVVDFSSGSGSGVRVEGTEYVTIQGLELKNSTQHGVRCRRAMNTRIDSCVIHHHGSGKQYGAGIEIRGNSTPSDRTEVINCEIYGGQSEENSDGITCGDSVTNTLVEGCFIHHNADDGLGLRGADFPHSPDEPATVRDSIFWRNGYFLDGSTNPEGDGYGIKNGHPDEENGGHTFERCLFYRNKNQGLGEVVSGATVPLTVHNCTSVDNPNGAFKMNESGVAHEVVNCIGQESGSGPDVWVSDATTTTTNNWDDTKSGKFNATEGDGVTIDFRSRDPSSSDFFRLVDGSPAIDAGTDVGLPFDGSAPDWGCYEYGTTTTSPSGAAVLRVYTGTEWKRAPAQYYDGSQFVPL